MLPRVLVITLLFILSLGAKADRANSLCDELLGLGSRGYLGTFDHLTESEWNSLRARGVLSWSERIFVVNNEDDAIRLSFVSARLPHLAPYLNTAPAWVQAWKPLEGSNLICSAVDFTCRHLADRGRSSFNPLMTGLYVIDPHAHLEKMSPEELTRFKASLPDRPIWEIGEEGHMTQLDPALVKLRFDPSQMVLDKAFDLEPQHLVQHGFFYPRQRTILSLERFPKLATPRHALGRRYQFRMVPHREGLTIEVFDSHAPKHRDVEASIHGTVQNGVYILESRHVPRPLPTYARYPIISLRDDLLAKGIRFVDATKVWELQNHPRGEFVAGDKFKSMLGLNRRRD